MKFEEFELGLEAVDGESPKGIASAGSRFDFLPQGDHIAIRRAAYKRRYVVETAKLRLLNSCESPVS